MAVALRAYRQLATNTGGSVSIAWPTGTLAGDLVVCQVSERPDSGGGPQTSGWTYHGGGGWTKRVTSTDLATALVVIGRVVGLCALSGAAGVGNSTVQRGATLTVAGAGLFVRGSTVPYADEPTSNSYQLGTALQFPDDKTWWCQWFRAATATGYLTVPDATDYFVAYEILPLSGPDAPTLTSPAAAAQVDRALETTVAWVHNSTQGGEQTGYQVRIRTVGSGTWSYLASDGTLKAAVQQVASATQSATIDAATLTLNQAYEWACSTQEASAWSAWSASSTFTPVTAPAVTAVTVTAPAEDLSPVVAWTMTAGVGSQVAWQAAGAVSTDADVNTAFWTSSVTASAATSVTVPVTTPWVNGEDYYAWVRVQQTGGMWTAWTKDDNTFSVTWTPPAAPSGVTAANVAGAPLAVTVAGIDAGADTLEIEWSLNGSTWEALTTIVPDATSEVVPVPLAEYGIARHYRARITNTVDGVGLWSGWTTIAAPVASTDTGAYLVADDGASYLAVTVKEDGGRQLVQGVAVSYGLGATTARVDRTATAGEAGSTVLFTRTLAARTAVVAWLTDTTHPAFYFRWNPESGVHVPATRMALASPAAWERLAQVTISQRHVAFDWVEQ